MRTVPSWDEYFMTKAVGVTARSKDPMTQVGAVVVDQDHNVVTEGYNGFPEGIQETHERWQRPTKYGLVLHAECNAIGRAARRGAPTKDCTMYVTHAPCLECAKLILAAGIRRVVYGTVAESHKESCESARTLLMEAGVSCRKLGEEMRLGPTDLETLKKARGPEKKCTCQFDSGPNHLSFGYDGNCPIHGSLPFRQFMNEGLVDD